MPRLTALVVAIGSAGDIHPNIGLGLALKKRGHRVYLIANSYFESLIRNVGLDFIQLGVAEEYLKTTEKSELFNSRKGFQVIAKSITDLIPQLYEIIVKYNAQHERVVVCGSNLAFGARIAQEKLGIPFASTYVETTAIRSVHDKVPIMALSDIFGQLPSVFKQFVFYLLDAFVLDSVFAAGVNVFRAKLGLPVAHRLFHNWVHSPELVIGFFPEWFAPPKIDWPRNTHLVGFPLFNPTGVYKDCGAIEFIKNGDPPIAFTAGSIQNNPDKIWKVSVEVCGVLGKRGIFLGKCPEKTRTKLPDNIRYFEYVPLGLVLSQSIVLVHHGGIGTAALALAAGVPHLVAPSMFDQPENAVRLERLGVGLSVSPKMYKTDTVASNLKYLLNSSEVAERCRLISEEVKKGDSFSTACDLIEALATNTKEVKK